jgi:hypothetical protein
LSTGVGKVGLSNWLVMSMDTMLRSSAEWLWSHGMRPQGLVAPQGAVLPSALGMGQAARLPSI